MMIYGKIICVMRCQWSVGYVGALSGEVLFISQDGILKGAIYRDGILLNGTSRWGDGRIK